MSRLKSMLSSAKDRFSNSSIYQKIFLILSVITLVAVTVYTFTSADWGFQSDYATANLLAEAMVREGSLFPESWTYGQDLWVFFLHTPIAFLTLFCDDYLLMHALAAMFFIILAIASCVWFSRRTLDSNAWVIMVPLMFCGVAWEWSNMVLGQCAYIMPMIYMFAALALASDCFDEKLCIRSKPKFWILAAFIVFLGLTGLRFVQVVTLPLIGAIAVVYYIENRKTPIKDQKKELKGLFGKLAVLGGAMLVGGGLFLLIISQVRYSAGVIVGITLTFSNVIQKLGELVAGMFGLFGAYEAVMALSVDGILSLIGMMSFAVFGIIIPILQFKNYKKETYKVKLFLIFSALHTAEIVLLFVFTTFFTSQRYLLSVQMLMFMISAHYIYKYVLPKTKLVLPIIVTAIVCAVVTPPMLITFTNVPKHGEVMAEKRSITEFLEQNDLHYGFATYWNAYNNTVYSDGRVEINGILLFDSIQPYYWLNDAKRYSEDVYKGKSFLLLTPEENDAFVKSSSYKNFGEPVQKLENSGYFIYVYSYNLARNNFSGFDISDRVPEMDGGLNAIYDEMLAEHGFSEAFFFDTSIYSAIPLNEASARRGAKEYQRKTMLITPKGAIAQIGHVANSFVLVKEYEQYDVYISEVAVFDITSRLPDSGTEINLMTAPGIILNGGALEKYGYRVTGNGDLAMRGPECPIVPEKYRFTLYYETEGEGSVGVFDVVTNRGEVIGRVEMGAEQGSVTFEADLAPYYELNFETRVQVNGGRTVLLKYVELTRITD